MKSITSSLDFHYDHSRTCDFWRQQITAWLDSGLSGHAFCKSQALVYHQLAYWRKKLELISSSIMMLMSVISTHYDVSRISVGHYILLLSFSLLLRDVNHQLPYFTPKVLTK